MQEIKESSAYRSTLKEKILDAAMAAFVQRGIKAVRMDDIASSLSISKRTLYEIYDDKESLLFEGVRRADQQKRDYLKRYAEEGHHVIEIILEAYRQQVQESHVVNPLFYSDMQRYPKIERYMAAERENTQEIFLKFIERGVEEGYFRTDVNYHILLHLFEAIAQHVIKGQLFNKYTIKDLYANLLLVPLRGLATEKGVKVLDKALH